VIFGIVAAVWVAAQFFIRREIVPGADLELDVAFAGRQDGQLLIEISATLANRGVVRHRYSDFRVVARYILPDDAIADGDERLHYQVHFPHTIDSRIGRVHRTFANASYIDPRLTFRHRYVTFVPVTATFVLVQCSLRYSSPWKKTSEVKNVQRLFCVPPTANPA
jgi:hypothetical protein